MNRNILVIWVVVAALLSGCATSTSVLQTKAPRPKNIATAALVPDHDNTPEMDANLLMALSGHGIRVTTNLPVGTRKTNQADLVVSYLDVWRWDLATYLESITVNLFDAESGEMLVTGRWSNAPAHGFQNPQLVLQELVTAMIEKLKTSKSKD